MYSLVNNTRRSHVRRTNVLVHLHDQVDLKPEPRRCSDKEITSTTSTHRRRAMSEMSSLVYASQMLNIEKSTKVKDWLNSFRNLDPRLQILDFFNDLALEGVDRYERKESCDVSSSQKCPKLLRGFAKSGMFTVWRPTSPDAIRKMITGEGTGKGLDFKGKSALRGPFSGYVPFLQISENEHKKEVGRMSVHKRVRVFYSNEASRDAAFTTLSKLSKSMVDKLSAGILGQSAHLVRILLDVNKIDDYVSSQGIYGINVPEKVLWEGYVVQNDITRPESSKYDTGRQSMPAFQQMNIDTLRNWKSESPDSEADPRPVLWHASHDYGCDPLKPQGLLMAYEEDGKVTPVVSDFDCFLLGTRGVRYKEAFRDKELSMLSWCIEEINGILSTPKEGISWTSRWLEVKKKLVEIEDNCCKEMPKFGYADPRSYSIIKGAVNRLRGNGAVRHGPECFNYAFPQELDNQFLVISDTFSGVPWRYVDDKELIDILSEKIDEGFTFPLNPKWLLCDPGWKFLYDKLMASQKPNVQDSMNIWYPPEIRDRIHEIYTKFPKGFDSSTSSSMSLKHSTHTRATLAEFELAKYRASKLSRRRMCFSLPTLRQYEDDLQDTGHYGKHQDYFPRQRKSKAALAA